MSLDKPAVLFDRDHEWADLVEFATSPVPGMRIGLVYGRRRQGKSYLLRRLCEATGGLYFMALQQERLPALQRFADVMGDRLGLQADALRFSGWEQALGSLVSDRAGWRGGGPRLIVIDEFPYLLDHSPELPSVIQALYDESKAPDVPPLRLVLCGSALSVMNDLLSGAKALRGRAQLDMCIPAFDYRHSGDFWNVSEPEVAFRLHAVLGGTPGYRDLIDILPPEHPDDFGEWLARTVLNPSHALFTEADYLLREDPRITDRALYHSVLGAISIGDSTPGKIAARIGRSDKSVAHPLSVLQTAGFVNKTEDVLLQRRAQFTVTDPIVRFHQLITAPRLSAFEDRRAGQAWQSAQSTWNTQILGPHFEELARRWTAAYAAGEALDQEVGAVGPTVVNDSSGRTQHELDVVALDEGETPRTKSARVALLGEAKSSDSPRGLTDVYRLERIRGLLEARGVSVGTARLALFGRSGFDPDVIDAARHRPDLLLVDLRRLYGYSASTVPE